MKTRVTELLGIEKPIIQGAMAWIADASLAAAVSEAGGLGIIACGSAPLSWVEQQVNEARSRTDKPIGANIMLMNPEAPELAKLLCDLHVDVVTTGAGSPAPYIDMWKEAGIKVIPVVASAALAKRMERAGADAVVAEGEVADGRGMVAAFALGAEGVQVGTRFLTAEECTVHADYKQKIVEAKDSDTIVTGRDSGHPVRQLKNSFARQAKALEAKMAAGEVDGQELENLLTGSLRRAVVDGDVKNGSLMAGEVACLVHDMKPARQIVDDLMTQAEQWGSCSLQQMAERNATRSWQ